MKKLIIPFAALVLFTTSCEKEITIDLPQPESKIVVDGGITTGEYAVVALTKSAGYFDPIDSASIANYVYTNALAILSDGITTDTLRLAFDPTMPIPLVFKGNTIVGQTGRTYTLTVTADGKTVRSTTTIPQPVPLDSTWFKPEIAGDSLGFIWATLSEPAGLGNGYRWYAKRIGKDDRYIAPFGSTFDDKFIEGKTFDFAYNRGVEQGSTAPDDNNRERGYFKTGDVVVVKFCAIGAAEAAFFRTFETEVANNGNPFAAPGVIKSNVEGGLGIFCGYSPAYDTVICQ
ncbi:MAG: hypothetical protein Fur0041_06140 [Bacteroidia bacterium]